MCTVYFLNWASFVAANLRIECGYLAAGAILKTDDQGAAILVEDRPDGRRTLRRLVAGRHPCARLPAVAVGIFARPFVEHDLRVVEVVVDDLVIKFAHRQAPLHIIEDIILVKVPASVAIQNTPRIDSRIVDELVIATLHFHQGPPPVLKQVVLDGGSSGTELAQVLVAVLRAVHAEKNSISR